MEYNKYCEYCGCRYKATRKHSRTCSQKCRHKLYIKGYSDPTRMKLVKTIPVCTKEETLSGLPPGKYKILSETCKKDKVCVTYVYRIIENEENVSEIPK